MNKPKSEIALEIIERNATASDPILDDGQYELLRLRGNTKDEVEMFENTLRREITNRCQGDPTFIPNLWVKYRVGGRKPKEIQYDWVHAFR